MRRAKRLMGGGEFKMSASENEMEVGEILGERKSRRGLEYLVRWKNFGKTDDTWEPLTNLKNAVQAIADFHTKATPKRGKKRSTSRSRSRSKGRSKSRSSSRSRKSASGKKSASTTEKKTTIVTTPTMTETRTETVTQSPGRTEQVTETVTKSVPSPVLTQRISSVTRTSETRTSKTPLDQVDSGAVQKPRGGAMAWCCNAWTSMCNCSRSLVCKDYPAIVVLATIAIIALTFVLQDNLNFEELWSSVVAFFVGIWSWLTTLVPAQKE
ncbi:testis-specific chromodomain protein Y 1-like [Dreissena polymorpha]|uniref:Chromo domain-containing protein n=1 Tax=Dreissena polymorpha TaxID=45954 RepID=A0A9D4IIA1_DREPO|nr:testis-specific chromodomain protein Y 1-like [Dreissena polymorpha]KAH3772758.1 hypothetical protein DPMN_174104 [Dreissena polymorpha]